MWFMTYITGSGQSSIYFFVLRALLFLSTILCLPLVFRSWVVRENRHHLRPALFLTWTRPNHKAGPGTEIKAMT